MAPAPAPTFTELLRGAVARAGGEPLVTFYDDATGERVELSFVTYDNWVAKTGSLLQDELGLERGDLVALDLPTHWLGPVWLGAVWSLGCVAGDVSQAGEADLVVCGPTGVQAYAAGPGPRVVACSLLPMGRAFVDPLPPGVTDFGEVVWAQPDSLLVLDPPGPHDPAWRDAAGEVEQAALLAADAPGRRLVTTTSPCVRDGLQRFLGPLAAGVGTVWVAGRPGPERLSAIAGSERASVDPAALGQPATPGPSSWSPT